MIVDRIRRLIGRRMTADRLKVEFRRCATFRLPDSICLNGKMQKLSLPGENGVRVAFIELLLDDCYGCRALQDRGEPIQTVLDIGGNVGLFGVAARSVFPDARIHSYEPNRNLEKYLSVQAESADFDYFMEAVGLEDGRIALDLDADSVQTKSRPDVAGDVPQVAFRKAIERLGGSVDLLKLDCEGAEWELFRDRESWAGVKNLAMEYHLFGPGQTVQAVKDNIVSLGFRITTFTTGDGYGLLLASRN